MTEKKIHTFADFDANFNYDAIDADYYNNIKADSFDDRELKENPFEFLLKEIEENQQEKSKDEKEK